MDINSQFIPYDFPLYNQINGPNFVAFIQAYYEWMEQTGKVRNMAHSLKENRSIDTTLNEFITHFQYEYLNGLPTNIVADKRLLIKHVLDLYRAKGTKRGIALLFRILFNEDISIYLPGVDICRASAATWVQPKYIELSDSPYLNDLVGKTIYSKNGKSTALVESYNIVRTDNRVINVLSLSSVIGNFLYGDNILSNDVLYDITDSPTVIGSLSSVSIEDGGAFFKVGDVVYINGKGSGALGRVATTRSENGVVLFKLLNGGFGFTMNAQVQVTGGGGVGATFSVGSLTNQEIYQLNTDVINDYYNEELDIESAGFQMTLANHTGGVFLADELVNIQAANSVNLDFTYLAGASLQRFETLSNTSLSISGIEPVIIDNPNFTTVIGTDAMLAKLFGGQTLVSSTSGCTIKLNSVMNKQVNICNGTITATNSSSVTINGANGYPIPTAIVTGLTSSATANVQSTTRLTNWEFPVYVPTNLDTPIDVCLTWENLVIGTIASLKGENPGKLYGSNPTVVVTEPSIADLGIFDGTGGIWGQDAEISATAIFADGIASSIQIIESGYGFQSGERLELSIDDNLNSIKGVAITQGTGVSQGYWSANPSGASDTSHIQDSYYYQNYSYEIAAQTALNTYKNVVEELVGPLGYVLFGKFAIKDSKSSVTSIKYDDIIQTRGDTVIYDSNTEELS